MQYSSTRGQAPSLTFEDVLLQGLATDGGLYVPDEFPTFTPEEIASWRHLTYEELALIIISPFIGDAIPEEDLKKLIAEAYTGFRHTAIAPLKQLKHNEWLLELFHGPTLAFKDFALQLLGKLLDYVLEKRKMRVAVLGATSGDTGSAAIEGCRGCKNVDIFILHPHGKISDVQRRQMTTVIADNIHNLAIESNFDDCQDMVKAMFRSQEEFLPEGYSFVAVNSINWARIMAQIVYYFYSALSLGSPDLPVSYSVPTGNFGDVLAGYIARKMGLPIEQLVVATNENDILHRFLQENKYEKTTLKHTITPSMDIAISSNFERLLYDVYDNDGDKVRELMENFRSQPISIDKEQFERITSIFSSYAVDEEEICQTIKQVYNETSKLIDPHSAVGVKAARECWTNTDIPMITLATAHPAKFPESILKATEDIPPKLPPHLVNLFEREERYDVLENDLETIKSYIVKHLRPLSSNSTQKAAS